MTKVYEPPSFETVKAWRAKLHEACVRIETLPPSEFQTQLVTLVSDVSGAMQDVLMDYDTYEFRDGEPVNRADIDHALALAKEWLECRGLTQTEPRHKIETNPADYDMSDVQSLAWLLGITKVHGLAATEYASSQRVETSGEPKDSAQK
jgi:hypothetical protein